MSVRKLSPELQLKAQLELNEDPGRIDQDIQTIKEWISQEPHLKARTDDQWILSFLRGCKFSLETTKNKLISYYGMRIMEPELFKNRDPLTPELQALLKTGFCLPLKKSPDPTAPRVLLLQAGETEGLLMANMTKITLMILDVLLNEDDNFAVAGHVVVHNFKDTSLQHIVEMPPNRIKNIVNCLQHAYPTRPKKFHYVNTPSFFPTLYGLVKPFLSDKIKNRISVHPDLDSLYESVPKSILPAEYGGEAGPIQDLINNWKQKVEDYRDWFLADKDCACTAIVPNPENGIINDDQVVGSFRQLTFD